MADEQLVRILKEGVKEWNAETRFLPESWRARLGRVSLPHHDLAEANLKRAYLYEAHLPGAFLYRADLLAADLRCSFLGWAILAQADCRDALLGGAELPWASLQGASLANADLRGAVLTSANLTGADLTGADLAGAFFGSTILNALDLSAARGLERVDHRGPSSIGLGTLAKSRGKIPESFLKGCGLSDWELKQAKLYDPDLSTEERIDICYLLAEVQPLNPVQVNPVFLSYSHADSLFVDQLQAALDEKGIRSWRDVHDAEAGPIEKVFDRAITLNPTMVLVLSVASANSDWVAWEIDKAIELEKELKRPVLCPIAVDDSWSEWLSPPHQARLKRYAILDFSGEEAVNTMMPRLLKGLHIHYRGETDG